MNQFVCEPENFRMRILSNSWMNFANEKCEFAENIRRIHGNLRIDSSVMIHFISYPQISTGYSKETFNIHRELISTMFI